ncbi:MAG TPA: hypothetical protein VES95_03570 [Dermatophilaceae bacterium]|nr:hypothetical protein [Dermatophilaceae bacterium]
MTEEPADTVVDAAVGAGVGAAVGAGVGVTRLLAEAASASAVLWVEPPDGESHPVWFVWHDDEDPRGPGPAAYVVSGPEEQSLPWLPTEVTLVLRSKDTGGRLLRLQAAVEELTPEDVRWDGAVEVLRPFRLNATGDVAARWRESATIHLLHPHGRPDEAPGRYAGDSRSVTVTPAPGTTARWRPWHLRGRSRRR